MVKLAPKITPEDTVAGDFQAEVRGADVLVPRELFEPLVKLGIRNAEQLLSQLHSFPTNIAVALGWKIADVNRATQSLTRQLKGVVSDDRLYAAVRDRQRRRRTFGGSPARHPAFGNAPRPSAER